MISGCRDSQTSADDNDQIVRSSISFCSFERTSSLGFFVGDDVTGAVVGCKEDINMVRQF
jgi:hypothetical protein